MQRKISLLQSNILASVYLLGTCFYFNDTNLIITIMISILILTKNEEQDLPDCLKSVAWCDDVHVLDSISNDKTIEIAKNFHAHTYLRRFDNYASQRNFALDNFNFKYDWIFILDADESFSESLENSLKNLLINIPSNFDGIRLRRKDFLNNKWLKHAQMTPFYTRILRKGKGRYHREINEVLEIQGDIFDFEGYFNHYPFSKGFSHWLNKHNLYSTMEAERWIQENNGNFEFSLKKALFSKDFTEKRYHQKGLYYKLPFRPLIKWIYLVILKRSFLDGKEGIIVATLQSIYEYFIEIKTKELMIQNSAKDK